MILRFIFFALFSVTFFATYAQNDYRPGYIVTNEGDTTAGEILYRESGKNHSETLFRPYSSTEIYSYSPTQLLAWHIDNDAMYRSLKVPVTQEDSTLIPVFAEVLVEGNATLIRYRSRFFIEKENTFYEMKNKQGTLVDRFGIRYRTNSNEYIGVLNYLFSDCQSVTSDISKAKINEEKLSKLVDSYNMCTEGKTNTYKDTKKWMEVSFNVLAGYQLSKLSFEGTPTEAAHLFGDYDVHSSVFPALLIELVFPRVNERFSFQSGIVYRTGKYTARVETTSSSEQSTHDVEFELDQLTIPTGFRFYLGKMDYSPFFEVGFSNTFYLNTTNYWRKETTTNFGDQEITEGEAIPFNQHQFGVWGGIGMIKSLNPKTSCFLLFRVERTNGFTKSITKASNANSEIFNTQIALGVRF